MAIQSPAWFLGLPLARHVIPRWSSHRRFLRFWLRTAAWAGVLLCIAVTGAFAQTPSAERSSTGAETSNSIGYTLTAWTAQTGLPPGDVLAISEDRAGYLWLGTSSGLVRFDGAVFTPMETRAGSPAQADRAVGSLFGARDGSLWIGHGGSGGIARLRGSDLERYAPGNGLFAGSVSAIVEDRAGTIWAGGLGGLSAFRNGRWEAVRPAGGNTHVDIYTIYEDRGGRLWLGTSAGVFAGSGDSFELRFPDAMFVQDFAEDLQGTMWVTDTRETIKRLTTGEPPVHGAAVRVPQSGWRLASDRRGGLWIAALGGGLLRLIDSGEGPARIERFSYETKIGGSPRSLLLDRDGNMWIGMRGGGLLRVAESSMRSQIPLDGLTNDGVRAVSPGADGSMWVATGHSLNQFAGGSRHVLDVAQTRTFNTDAHGTLWVTTALGFGRVENGRFVAATLPADIRWEAIMAAASDAAGNHWLCSSQQSLIVWRDSVRRRFDDAAAIAGRSCSAIYSDRRDRQWIGFTAGGIAVHANGVFTTYDEANGLAGGSVLAILEDGNGSIWVATRDGVSRFQDGRFTTVTQTNGPFADLTAALVQDADGYLWVGVSSGAALVRFLPSEMDRVAADPSHHVEYALYDASDGLHGEIAWQQSRALAARAPDDRLWFVTGVGLTVVDPRALTRNQRPVAPRIETISADGEARSPVQQLELPSSVSNLTITWGAVSLGAASKLRFRYRLEGYDADWVMSGARRTSSYSHLPPGRYRFRVSATNDGVWTDGGSWEFAVAPPFYRSGWFLTLSVLGIAGAIAGAWWLRVSTMQKRYALVFAERALVSREIHDTLLQNLAAIGIELEAIVRQLDPRQTSSVDALRRLQHQTSHSLGEARDLVVALRQTGISKTPGLVETLRKVAEHTTAARGTQLDLQVSGSVTRCSSDVELQLLRIGQEAVNNAVLHGRATAIEIAIDFSDDTVAMRVRDNGCGFVVNDEPDAADGTEHLGLLGMRERAERIRARLTIASTPGAGTVIEAIAPFGGR